MKVWYSKAEVDLLLAQQQATLVPRDQVVLLTQAAYDALTPDPTALYFITG